MGLIDEFIETGIEETAQTDRVQKATVQSMLKRNGQQRSCSGVGPGKQVSTQKGQDDREGVKIDNMTKSKSTRTQMDNIPVFL